MIIFLIPKTESTGSTSFPKPIVITHRICARWAMFPCTFANSVSMYKALNHTIY